MEQRCVGFTEVFFFFSKVDINNTAQYADSGDLQVKRHPSFY